MTEFAPIAVRDLMIDPAAPDGLAVFLGAGDDMRVFPMEIPQGTAMPAVAYMQLEEVLSGNKDATEVIGWDLMVLCHAEDPGAYMQTQRLARLVRQACDRKTIQVQLDEEEEGTLSTLELRYTGKEDLDVEDKSNINITALTFRAFKIQ